MIEKTSKTNVKKLLVLNAKAVEHRIGIIFKNIDLLIQALTHRSFLNEARDMNLVHNERLEFLGDAVLNCIISEYLLRLDQDLEEGRATFLRSALVNNSVLAILAEELELEKYVLLSRGERKSFQIGSKSRKYILACVVEAIMGAIHFDRGIGTAEIFCLEFIIPKLKEIIERELWRDPKSYLQELTQENLKIVPTYLLLSEDGPGHDKKFHVGVQLKTELIGRGFGKSKKEAEVSAAKEALSKYSGKSLSAG